MTHVLRWTTLSVAVAVLSPVWAGAAINATFEDYPLGPVSGASPDNWVKISGNDFEVTSTNPIAGTKSLILANTGDARTILEFTDETGPTHAEFRIRPGVDANSNPRTFFQFNDPDGWPGPGVYFEMYSGSPLLGYYDGGTFLSVAGGYVRGNDHLVSMDIDPVTDKYDLVVTDLTASQTLVSLTGLGTRTPIASVAYFDIYTFAGHTNDTLLDNIVIGPIPEPASAFGALGLMGCFALRRRSFGAA